VSCQEECADCTSAATILERALSRWFLVESVLAKPDVFG
jgi:hypothetical protein